MAQIGINTYEGASKALAQGGIWGAIQAALVIAQGLAMASKASGIGVPKRSYGQSKSSGFSAPNIQAPEVATPTFSEVLTDDINVDTTAEAINNQSRAPLKAYVVLSDLAQAEQLNDSINSNATL